MTERRRDPTTDQWVTFAAHRQDRTFLPAAGECPLCPTRDPGHPTEVLEPAYDMAVFDNRFPSLLSEPPPPSLTSSSLYEVEPAWGATEVVLYTSDHGASLAQLGADRLTRLVDLWAHRYAVLGAREEVKYVFIFENKGEVIGVTLHHPHGQIYAYPEIPPRPRLELETAGAYLDLHGRCVFCDVVARERADEVRVVAQNLGFIAVVPFAARFPYEVHVLSLRHATSLLDLTTPERRLLAEILNQVLRGYDALFGFSLPYVMSMHQSPTDDGEWLAVSHFHVEFTPPHRTATKLKYLAGSELGAGAFINDTAPEATAAQLRDAVERAQHTSRPA
ncbi:MAG TPA: galactose-1-phosphate uridylyltransferase [Mycobacteriales bacterium]|nr:galactose-1-phosphate uridylyltransferase [Mycobacteriales bacterium]